MHGEGADHVGDVDEAEGEEDALDDLGGAARHGREDEDRGAHNERDLECLGVGHVQIAAEDRRRRCDAGELGRGVSDVAQDEEQQAPEGYLDAEVLADEVGQPLPGDGPHARAHLLHDDERDRDRDQQPQQRVTELRAGLRIGPDAADVVVGIGRDDAGPDDREKHDDGAPYVRSHEPGSGRGLHQRSIRWSTINAVPRIVGGKPPGIEGRPTSA